MKVTTLDHYTATVGDVPELIKIDAEGAERQILEGAAETIGAARPLITVEVGDTTEEQTSRNVLEYAAELGYVTYELTPMGLHLHALRDVYGYGNLLLVPGGTKPPPVRPLGTL